MILTDMPILVVDDNATNRKNSDGDLAALGNAAGGGGPVVFKRSKFSGRRRAMDGRFA